MKEDFQIKVCMWCIIGIIVSILLFLSTSHCKAQIPKDKQDHLLAGTLIGFSMSSITINSKPEISLAWSLGTTVVIGGGKELIYDKALRMGTPEWKDFGWTMMGSVAGFGIVQGFKGVSKWIDRRHERLVLQIK